ncbi:unnamed protein product [Spirodela intermedia]|uniref:Uncharacterized protein n=2 Tax=Spirodela intermedia TaxID=51605 RepID=A0A7I8JXU8_SPIIN|nr:unnamed protein product [Spirodela intermedia]CAA6653758.1 unnamed protein product [Spirodela intermedia]CAA7388120.1 unnamed protein product [Spirodela intermedia]
MAMGTVSVAELLGHCMEVYKRNQNYVDLLQDRLSSFGYVPAQNDLPSSRSHPEELLSSGSGKTSDEKISHRSSLEAIAPKDVCAIRALIEISKNDYDKLPAYVRSLASWEDLQEAVTKINLGLSKQDPLKNCDSFNEADFAELGLGRKGKSYVLALIRMNRLAVDTVGGSVIYRIVANEINKL